MARNPELDAAVSALNNATNRLGEGAAALSSEFDALSTRVFALVEKINTRMSDAEVASVKDALDQETNRIDHGVLALDAIADSLRGLAADPVEPVPEPVPEPVDELPTEPVEEPTDEEPIA